MPRKKKANASRPRSKLAVAEVIASSRNNFGNEKDLADPLGDLVAGGDGEELVVEGLGEKVKEKEWERKKEKEIEEEESDEEFDLPKAKEAKPKWKHQTRNSSFESKEHVANAAERRKSLFAKSGGIAGSNDSLPTGEAPPLLRYEDVRELLRPGDVLAFGGATGSSNVIKLVTRSPVSHTAIVIRTKVSVQQDDVDSDSEDGEQAKDIDTMYQVIEAVGEGGVVISRIRDKIENYHGEIWWLPLSHEVRARLNLSGFLNFALQQKGKKYDLQQAIFAGVDFLDHSFLRTTLNQEDFSKFFCSELTAAALEAGGVIKNINASEVTPIDICRFQLYRNCYYQIKLKPDKDVTTPIPNFNTVNPDGFGIGSSSRTSLKEPNEANITLTLAPQKLSSASKKKSRNQQTRSLSFEGESSRQIVKTPSRVTTTNSSNTGEETEAVTTTIKVQAIVSPHVFVVYSFVFFLLGFIGGWLPHFLIKNGHL